MKKIAIFIIIFTLLFTKPCFALDSTAELTPAISDVYKERSYRFDNSSIVSASFKVVSTDRVKLLILDNDLGLQLFLELPKGNEFTVYTLKPGAIITFIGNGNSQVAITFGNAIEQ